MSSELSAWIKGESKNYFTKQETYYNGVYSTSLAKKQKQVNEIFHKNSLLSNANKRMKKRMPRQRYDTCYEISLDTILQLSYTYLNRVGWREEKVKQKECNKTAVVAKKNKMSYVLPWGEGEEKIVAFYKKTTSYSSCRLIRTDKRELVKMAQDIHMSRSLRRTSLPVVKMSHNLIRPMSTVSLMKGKSEVKKVEKVVQTVLPKVKKCNSIRETDIVPEKKLMYKKRRVYKELIPKTKVKSGTRKYMEVNTVDLNLFNPSVDNFCTVKEEVYKFSKVTRNMSEMLNSCEDEQRIRRSTVCSDTSSNSEMRNLSCSLPKLDNINSYVYRGRKIWQTEEADNTDCGVGEYKDNETCDNSSWKYPYFLDGMKIDNKIHHSVPRNVYTINNNYSNIKVPFNDSCKEGLKISDILLKSDSSISLEKQQINLLLGSTSGQERNSHKVPKFKKRDSHKDYVNILQPVVISTDSGTSFEMKPLAFHSIPCFSNKCNPNPNKPILSKQNKLIK